MRRQSQAAAERKFIEARLGEMKGELRDAENQLQRFLQQNQGFRNSSELAFTHDRLQREVAMRQQVFTSLSQWYEQAKIDEVRNTPVITVVEQPNFPVRPDRRGLALKSTLGAILGGVLGLMLALGRDFLRQSRDQGHEGFEEFETLRKETAEDVSGLWRRLRVLVLRS